MPGDFLVVADDGNVLRDVQAGFLQRLVAADRGAVVLAEDGGLAVLRRHHRTPYDEGTLGSSTR